MIRSIQRPMLMWLDSASKLAGLAAALVQVGQWMGSGNQNHGGPKPPSESPSRFWKAKRFAMALGKYALVFHAGRFYAEYEAFEEQWEQNDGDVRKILIQFRNSRLKKTLDKELVLVSQDARLVKKKSAGHGGWHPKMAEYCGHHGTVAKSDDDDNTVKVQFRDGESWWFNQDVVTPLFSKKQWTSPAWAGLTRWLSFQARLAA